MMPVQSKLLHIRNEKGIITIDFIFAFVLVMGFGALMFSLALTLTLVEVTQYITFASSRAFYASHVAPENQERLALMKYEELTLHPAVKTLFSNGWFSIQHPPDVGNLSLKFPEYRPSDPEDPNLFWGVGTRFIARMLDFHLPFYGSTTSEGDGSGDGFNTYIASYLGREVTARECIAVITQRWKAIRALSVTNGVPYGAGTSEEGFVPTIDNGC